MNNIYEPEFVKDLFNKMSESYERMNYITSFGFSIRWRKQFLSKAGTSKAQLRIIDLLSGRGENWIYLKKQFPNADFYALDFSEEMIKQAAKRNNKIFKGTLNLSCQDFLQNNLPNDYFDVVTCAYGLKTFNEDQIDRLAAEVRRILKTGGKFTFVEVSKPKNAVLNYLYGFYLGKVIPILGKLFLGNPEDYKMLWVYTQNFQEAGKTKQIFEKHGLAVSLDSYFFACASGITGRK